MRMRKLPWAEDFLKKQEVVIQIPAQYKGKWREQLKTEIIHVEIGTGKGDYWVHMAKQYPDIGWIGIEKNNNAAALAVRKYTQQCEHSLPMLFINEDAEQIEAWFAPNEIDVIHLNFSDPWPKKRAHKKRLSNKKFIAQYARILKDDGEIQMKTDNSSLFEYSILEFQKENWYLRDISVDFRRTEHPEDVITEYEARFMGRNQPIYRAVWTKHPIEEADASQ